MTGIVYADEARRLTSQTLPHATPHQIEPLAIAAAHLALDGNIPLERTCHTIALAARTFALLIANNADTALAEAQVDDAVITTEAQAK